MNYPLLLGSWCSVKTSFDSRRFSCHMRSSISHSKTSSGVDSVFFNGVLIYVSLFNLFILSINPFPGHCMSGKAFVIQNRRESCSHFNDKTFILFWQRTLSVISFEKQKSVRWERRRVSVNKRHSQIFTLTIVLLRKCKLHTVHCLKKE